MVDIAKVQIQADSRSVKTASNDLNTLDKSGRNAQQGMNLLRTAVVALGGALSVQQIIRYADSWQSVTNQLKVVQKEGEDLGKTQQLLINLSNETLSSYESTANLYARLSRASADLGLNQGELAGITRTINQAFVVSGATATEAAAAITQLSQGLAAGALRGEEFNSVSEQAPIIMDALGAQLNMTRGELREFAAEGGITAEIVVEALQNAADGIDDSFSKMTATFGQSMAVANNNLLEFLGNSEKVQGGTQLAGNAIVTLSENLDTLADVAMFAAVAFGASKVSSLAGSLGAFITSSLAANKQTLVYNSSLMVMQRQAATTGLAMTALNRTMGLLGGPVGLAITAAFGVYQLVDAFRDTDEEAANAADSMDQLTDSIKEYNFVTGDAEAITRQIEHEINQLSLSLNTAIAAYGAGSEEVRLIQERIEELQSELRQSTSATDDNSESVTNATRSYQELRAAMGDVENLVESETRNLVALRKNWNDTALALTTVSANYTEAAERFEWWENKYVEGSFRMMGVTDERTSNEVRAIEWWTKVAEQGAERREQAEVRAAEVAQDNWQRTHEFLTNNLMTLGETSGNIFENIADSFVNMVKRMVAEWAASGIMNLLGMGSGSSATNVIGGLLKGGLGTGGSIGSIGSTLAGGAKAIGGAVSGGLSGVGGAISAIPGWGWAAGGIAAAAAALSKDSTPSGNAGLLLHALPHSPERQFDVPEFDSGFKPVGSMRRSSPQEATQVIDLFRTVDSALTGIARGAGLNVDYSNAPFNGYNEEGSGSGIFLGQATEDGKAQGVGLDQQLTGFAKDWVKALGGQISAEQKSILLSSSSADELIARAAQMAGIDGSHAMGLNRVPFDGYRAELHAGERVLTKAQTDRMDSMQGQVPGLSGKIEQLVMQIALYTKRTSQTLDDWNARGLPDTRPA